MWVGIGAVAGVGAILFLILARDSGERPEMARDTVASAPGMGQSNRLPSAGVPLLARQMQHGGDLQAFQEADERGEFLGGFGTATPAELLAEISELRAEPFAPLVLDKLELALRNLVTDREKIQAAVLLNRYGRASGTEALRLFLRQNPNSGEAIHAAIALAMSKDSQSLDLLEKALQAHAGNPEFARAVTDWGEPHLIAKAKELLEGATSDRVALATILALAGDAAGEPVLREYAARKGHPAFTAVAEAALVRLGAEPAEPLLQRLREAARKPRLSMGYLSEALHALGPQEAVPLLMELVEDYTQKRLRAGEDYKAWAAGVKDGTRTPGDAPSYPTAEEALLKRTVELLSQWKVAAAADPIADALEAAQQGVYIPALNRQMMAALFSIDPKNARGRLTALGFSEKEIDAGADLAGLHPVPHLLKPQQKSATLSRRKEPDQW